MAAFVAVVVLGPARRVGHTAVLGAVAVDAPALFLQGTILLVGVLGILLIAERDPAGRPNRGARAGRVHPAGVRDRGSVAEQLATKAGVMQTEVFPLTLFAVGGMLLFPAADDLLTMFIALEVLSCRCTCCAGWPAGVGCCRRKLAEILSARRVFVGVLPLRRRDAVRLRRHADLGASPRRWLPGSGKTSLALIGTGLVLVGVLFKVGAVPFHSWIPDVYQGADPITAFMAAATKIAAFGAMLRIFYVALPELRDDWRPVLWAVAILTMVVGTVTAVTQTDVKRMLAYSAVAHTGFILTGVIAENEAGLSSTLFYLFAYGFSTSAPSRWWSGPQRGRRGGHRDGPVGGLGGAIPLSAWCFRCSCWPSRASR